MSKPSVQTKEYLVQIPKKHHKKHLSILKFNESLNVKPQQWTSEILRMEREDNRRHGMNMIGEISQEFGEGSEYGRAAREELRRKKYGRQSRKYEHDKQPWKLAIEQTVQLNPKSGETEKATTTTKTRKFRSIREAGAGEHADYWVFYKSGNDLEAHKVDEWYQFLPAVTYKYLDAEQAEERYKERDKVYNNFALKTQIQKQLAEQEEQQKESLRKGTASLKIKDEMSSGEEDATMEEENGMGKEGKGAKNKSKKKKVEQAKKERKKQRVENADEVAAYESEDGQDEGREYDYMSDSGSDTDREELNADEKVDKDLVGVADEQGLKGSLESDEEEEETEEDAKEDSEKEEENDLMEEEMAKKLAETRTSSKAVKNVDKIMAQKSAIKNSVEFDENESSNSDSEEDPDSGKVKSILFIQDKRKKQPQPPSGTSQQRKRPAGEESVDTISGAAKSSAAGDQEAKRPKLSHGDAKASDVISEAFIRKLLEKKPHSTKQLLTKVNQRLQQLHGEEANKDKKFVTQLADILKKIEPYQFRKKNEAGKEVLYFSMNRTA